MLYDERSRWEGAEAMTFRHAKLSLAAGTAFALCLLTAAVGLKAQNAGIAGKWLFALTMEQYFAEYAADLQTDGERVTGTFAGQKVDGTFKNGELVLSFPFHPPEAPDAADLVITAHLKDGALSGSFTFSEYAGSVEAKRSP